MTAWSVLAFGLVLAGSGVRAILRERRAARVGRRPVRQDLVASCSLLLVIGGVALLLVLPRAP